MTETIIETLLNKPYWVIDLLPMQVPQENARSFFTIEPYLLSGPRMDALRRTWTDLLLKLSCYFDFLLCGAEDEPHAFAPEELAQRIGSGEYLALLSVQEESLIVVDNDGTCITAYHPSVRMLDLIRLLATAEGLFVWQADRE